MRLDASSLSLSLEQLGSPRAPHPEFDALLLAVLRQRKALAIRLEPESLYLETRRAPADDHCELRGHWCSAYLGAELGEGCCLLTLPLLYRLDALILPSAWLLQVRTAQSSMADWLMRQLFIGLLQALPMRLVTAALQPTQSTPLQALLNRAYLGILDARLQDPVLRRPNAVELIRAAHQLPLNLFQSALLEQSAAFFRAQAPADLSASDRPLLQRQFLRERQWMLARC